MESPSLPERINQLYIKRSNKLDALTSIYQQIAEIDTYRQNNQVEIQKQWQELNQLVGQKLDKQLKVHELKKVQNELENTDDSKGEEIKALVISVSLPAETTKQKGLEAIKQKITSEENELEALYTLINKNEYNENYKTNEYQKLQTQYSETNTKYLNIEKELQKNIDTLANERLKESFTILSGIDDYNLQTMIMNWYQLIRESKIQKCLNTKNLDDFTSECTSLDEVAEDIIEDNRIQEKLHKLKDEVRNEKIRQMEISKQFDKLNELLVNPDPKKLLLQAYNAWETKQMEKFPYWSTIFDQDKAPVAFATTDQRNTYYEFFKQVKADIYKNHVDQFNEKLTKIVSEKEGHEKEIIEMEQVINFMESNKNVQNDTKDTLKETLGALKSKYEISSKTLADHIKVLSSIDKHYADKVTGSNNNELRYFFNQTEIIDNKGRRSNNLQYDIDLIGDEMHLLYYKSQMLEIQFLYDSCSKVTSISEFEKLDCNKKFGFEEKKRKLESEKELEDKRAIEEREADEENRKENKCKKLFDDYASQTPKSHKDKYYKSFQEQYPHHSECNSYDASEKNAIHWNRTKTLIPLKKSVLRPEKEHYFQVKDKEGKDISEVFDPQKLYKKQKQKRQQIEIDKNFLEDRIQKCKETKTLEEFTNQACANINNDEVKTHGKSLAIAALDSNIQKNKDKKQQEQQSQEAEQQEQESQEPQQEEQQSQERQQQEQQSQPTPSLLEKIKAHPKKAVAGVAVVGIGGVLVYNYVLAKPKKKSKKRSM